jgi:hypothetical protein
MRICSLLPSATEIVAELGLAGSLVAVSEECDWPPEVRVLPVVTASRVDTTRLSSLERRRVSSLRVTPQPDSTRSSKRPKRTPEQLVALPTKCDARVSALGCFQFAQSHTHAREVCDSGGEPGGRRGSSGCRLTGSGPGTLRRCGSSRLVHCRIARGRRSSLGNPRAGGGGGLGRSAAWRWPWWRHSPSSFSPGRAAGSA